MRNQLVGWCAILVAWLVGIGACVENRQSVTILQMQAADDNCMVSSGQSSNTVQMGRLDIWNAANVPTEYYLFPLVKNNLLSTASTDDVERNQIEIVEAVVELDLGASGGTAKFNYPAFITLSPGESAAVQVRAIPSSVSEVLAGRLTSPGDSQWVRIGVRLRYQHGEYEKETHQVDFPVLVGRYILFPSPEETPGCDSGLVPEQVREGNGCNIYQDKPIDCCTMGGNLICPAEDMGSLE